MAISLLKRYKNEINAVLKTLKSSVNTDTDKDYATVIFRIESPYFDVGATVYSYIEMSKGINYKNKLKVIEEKGLVYIGVDIDKNFVKDLLDRSFSLGTIFIDSYGSNGLDDYVAYKFMRECAFHKEESCFDAYSGSGKSLNDYKNPLLLGNFQKYVDEELYVQKGEDGNYYYKNLGWSGVYDATDKYIGKALKNGELQKNDFFKAGKKAVEDFYNAKVYLADGEFPKLSNRNFLPFVTINFEKDEIVYLYQKRNLEKITSFPAYTKGVLKDSLQGFLASHFWVFIPTNTLCVELDGKASRIHQSLTVKVNI